jgi:hypothetical protein
MGWGGGLILSKAQKSATTPTHPQLRATFGLKQADKMQAKSMAERVPASQRNVEMYIALPMHSLKLCTQWLCSVGKDRIFIGLLGEMWKSHLYIVS